jgi:hypothetical protein
VESRHSVCCRAALRGRLAAPGACSCGRSATFVVFTTRLQMRASMAANDACKRVATVDPLPVLVSLQRRVARCGVETWLGKHVRLAHTRLCDKAQGAAPCRARQCASVCKLGRNH